MSAMTEMALEYTRFKKLRTLSRKIDSTFTFILKVVHKAIHIRENKKLSIVRLHRKKHFEYTFKQVFGSQIRWVEIGSR